jgi:hypothetical protein
VKSAAVYTAARVLIFLVLAGLGWLAGLRGFLLVFVALLVSVPLSYYFLARQRDAFAADVERRVNDAGPGARTCAPSCAATTTRPTGQG